MKLYLRLYGTYLKVQILGLMEYKVDFFIGLSSVLVEQVLSLVFITVIFNNIQNINGWKFEEILLIYAFLTLGRSIHIIFFDNMWIFGSKYIQQGEFDRVLLKPVNSLFQIVAEKINYQGIGQIIIGGIALVISVNKLQFQIDICKSILIFVGIICSGMVFVGIHLFFMTMSFWMVDSMPVVSSVFSLSQFAQYPVKIFPTIIQIIIVFVIPYAFTGFIPAESLLNFMGYQIVLIPLVSFIVVFIGYRFWKYGERKYTSTGT